MEGEQLEGRDAKKVWRDKAEKVHKSGREGWRKRNEGGKVDREK